MKNKKNLSREELEINKRIEEKKIRPVLIPRIKTLKDILKYQLCSEIIRYKNDNSLVQNDIAKTLMVNKSEVSKLFSYNLAEFSTDRLLGMVETLMKAGANINLEVIFEEVKKKTSDLDKKIKRNRKLDYSI
jgi:predicted XRE-type DNA-binding protein